MHWLLLPVEANAQRRLADEAGPSFPTWSSMDDAGRCQNSATPAPTPSAHDEAIQSLVAQTRPSTEVVHHPGRPRLGPGPEEAYPWKS